MTSVFKEPQPSPHRISSPPKRFLFLFSDTGGGHRAATQAVKREMELFYGDRVVVEMVDVFVELQRWPMTRFPDWYPMMVSLKSIPWWVMFRLTDWMGCVAAVSYLTWPYVGRPICKLLQRHPADVIVSFHGVPNYTLALAFQQMGWRNPFAIVTLDMVTAHASWFAPGADLYCVPTEATKRLAVRWGVEKERVLVTGMPVRRSFTDAMSMSREAARSALNLPDDLPVVLFVGGGQGLGPLGRVIQAVVDRRPRARLVVIAGRNRDLQEKLQAMSGMESTTPLHVEGFVSNMELWMRAADILVSKAGPNTISEAFVAGLPIILYAALPGQETGNVTHVVDHDAGIWAPQVKQAADAVVALVNDSARREAMAQRARALAYPFAAEQIAQQLWALGESPQLLLRPAKILHRPLWGRGFLESQGAAKLNLEQ